MGIAALAAILWIYAGVSVFAAEAGEGEASPAEGQVELTEEEKLQQELDGVYVMPVQSNEREGWPQGPGTYGEAAIVMEVESGAILYAKNIDERHFPASITKLLTALVAFENGKLEDPVLFSHESLAFLEPGDAYIGMKEGNQITLEQALYATLLASANEGAYAVAENVGKNAGHDYEWFLEQMNARCRELGGENSNFTNPHGLHDENHYTCARDMALIGRELFRHPEFFNIVQTLNYTIPASDTTEEHIFQQKHKMLKEGNAYYYEYAVGGKTGYTDQALSTLVTMADNGDMQLVCVVLKTHGANVYPDTRNLLEYGFANFSKVLPAANEKSEDVAEILDEQNIVAPVGVEFKDLDLEIVPDEETGDEGLLEYGYKGIPVGTVRAVLSQTYLEKRLEAKEKAQKESEDGDKKSGKKKTDASENRQILKKCILGAAGVLLVVLAGAVVKLFLDSKRREKKKKKK